MRRGLISILLLVSICSFGQVTRGFSFQVTPVPESYGTSYTDDFESLLTGNLNGQDGWTIIDGGLSVVNEGYPGVNYVVKGTMASFNAAIYDGTYSPNQYAWDTVYVAEWTSAGPLVLGSSPGSGGSYYAYFYDASSVSYLIRMVNGSAAYLDAGSGHSDGDVLRLEVVVGASSTVLTCYINGIVDTSIGTSGVYTDSDASRLTSGSPGVFVWQNASNGYATYSAGGDL